MIEVPNGILTSEEVSESAGKPADELTLSFKNISLDSDGLVLELDMLVNFDVKPRLERVMRDRLIRSLGNINDVKFNYFYDESYGESKQQGSRANSKPAENPKMNNNGIILGKRITMAETAYENLAEISGARTKVAVSGTVFEIEIKDTNKKNFWVMTLRISRGPKAVAVKAGI